MKGFLHRNEALVGCNPEVDDPYIHVHLKDIAKLSERIIDRVTSGELIVVYAPCQDRVAATWIEGVASTLQNCSQSGILLILHNPAGLLGLKADDRVRTSSSMYHISRIGAAKSAYDWETSLEFIAHPLDCLRDQCGWHFVMEIVRWISGSVESRNGATRAMFSTINQLPFQMLLLILRWSHFHPQLVRVCGKKLRRQLQLIPQARIHRDLIELQRREEQIWRYVYPSEEQVEETPAMSTQKAVLASPFIDAPSHPQEITIKLGRLSECCLWDAQKHFYKDEGIRAWSSGKIPFGVSSSSFLAAAYARVVVDFLLSNADCVEAASGENSSPNCFVWEAASGSCKFLHSFMLHFTDLVAANAEFKRRGLIPLVVATDLSEQVVNSRRQMACFRQFIKRGQLDFALFDTQEFVHGDPKVSGKKKTLRLVHSRRQWNVGSDGPVAMMGNYFLDSLRADIFTVAIQQDPVNANVSKSERAIVQDALLRKDTSSIANMDVVLRPVPDPRTQPVYEDERFNTILVEILDHFHSQSGDSTTAGSVSSTGLVLFPVEAFKFLLALFDRTCSGEADAFPIALLAGDARFSFRDAVSSAFITTTTVESTTGSTDHASLELPQLSPHPDCFCLPVDFEIFELFFKHLNNTGAGISARSQLVSAPASDTFDVFFATVEPTTTAVAQGRTKALQASFRHQFARFTPGDCDLLWGMMSFDDGARCFSMDTLLALLAQTGWDFDLFSELHWELLSRWKKLEHSERIHYQHALIEAGVKSWRTIYHMEQQSETDTTTRWILLQLARWFYELEAYTNVLEVLMPWHDEPHEASNSNDVDIFYLLGLTNLRKGDNRIALPFFRHCARLAPTKMKFQRQVASLQWLQSSSNSSIDAA